MPHRPPRLLSTITVYLGIVIGYGFSLPEAKGQLPAPTMTEVLAPTAVRDRRLESALESALELLDRKKFPEAVAQIQMIFDQERDAWMLTSSGDVVSIRQATLHALRNQPQTLADYRRLQGPSAKLDLARARASGRTTDFLSVWRRYLLTEHGAAAAEWLLQRWLDSGAWDLGAGITVQSLRSGCPVSERFLKMGALSCELAGWVAEAQQVRKLSPGESSDRPLQGLVTSSGQFGPLGSEISPPILQPDWTTRLEARQKDPRFEVQLNHWADEQRESDLPTAVGWSPVSAGNLVIFRDLDTIRAIHTASGETVWRFESSTGLSDLLNPAESAGAAVRYRSAIWDSAMANSLVSRLATDGQRIFAVNDTESLTFAGVYGLEANQVPHFERRKAAQSELMALRIDEDLTEPRLLWKTSDLSATDRRLVGHAFLGPPLSTQGCLFTISERDRQMCVTAMLAGTGEVLWQQPIAEAERAVVEERGRSFRATIPVAAHDMVLCPTHLGLLVAVDRVSGDLRWSHHSLEQSADPFPQRFRSLGTISQRRHGAFPATPLVSEECVVYLPSQSEHLYCLELETGVVRWVIKNTPAEFLAAIHEETVLVVGSREVQALRLDNGQLVWRTALEGVVSGTGLACDNGYLLPLDTGEVLDLDWKTGIPRSFRYGVPSHAVGHLVATRTQIISVGLEGVTAFPQSNTVLQRLQVRSETEPAAAIALARAEIYLTSGNLDAAVSELEQAMHASAPRDIRQRARETLVEVYFELALSSTEQSARWLARLGELELTPAERVRWLVAATAAAWSNRDFESLNEQARLLAGCPASSALFDCPEDRQLQISAEVWLAILARRTAEGPEGEMLSQKYQEIAVNQPQSLAYRAWELLAPQSQEIAAHQRDAARSAMEAGDYPQALVWLRRQGTAPEYHSAESQQLLARLFTEVDWPTAAAAALWDSNARPSRSGLPDVFGIGLGAERTRAAWNRLQPVNYPVDAVQIGSRPRQFYTVAETPTTRTRESTPYEDYQRQVLAASDASPVEWLVRNSERGTEVAGFDKLSSRKVFEQVLLLGAGPPGASVQLSPGAFVPFAMMGEVQAVSPIPGPQGHLAWTLKLPEWTERSGQAVCGPITATTCYFQWKNVLLAVDPLDGRVRWRRNDLESGSGLYGDARIGLLADDQIVFLLAADKTRYTVMDAATGLVIRQGSLDMRSYRSELGRYILHFTDDGDDRRIRIWDPATDEWILDDRLKSRQLHNRGNDGTVAWITPQQRLRLFSVEQRKLLIDVELTHVDWNAATQLRVMPIDGWYLASLGRSSPSNSSTQFHMPVPDRLIPGDTFKDDVFAIGADGQTIQWRRQMPQRSFLKIAAHGLPFFVTATLVKNNSDPNRRWLRVEAIDRDTGVLLGVGDEMPVDRLLHADYDGASGKITLIGRDTEIELDFSRRVQRLQADLPAL